MCPNIYFHYWNNEYMSTISVFLMLNDYVYGTLKYDINMY